MALIAVQPVPVPALNPTPFVACSGGGDTIRARTGDLLLVRCTDATTKTVTVVVPGTIHGQNIPDIAVVVPATTGFVVIPLLSEFRDPVDGLVDVTYSAVTGLTAAVIRP